MVFNTPRTIFNSSLACLLRNPCLRAFWAAAALPAGVAGPVALAQGCQRLIASDWRWRRSGVQPWWFMGQVPIVRLPENYQGNYQGNY